MLTVLALVGIDAPENEYLTEQPDSETSVVMMISAIDNVLFTSVDVLNFYSSLMPSSLILR